MGRNATDTSGWIGRRFDSLVVVETGKRIKDRPACLCYCDCDKYHEKPVLVRASDLLSGKVKSCGCGRSAPRPYTGSVKVGDRSGRLTVVSVPTSIDDRDADGDYVCHCKCDCGHNDDYVCKCTDIQTKNVKSCGCIDQERLRPIKIGEPFGDLIVEKEVERDPVTNRRRYRCRCKCGGTKDVAADKLIGGEVKSCGCWKYRTKDNYEGKIKIGDVFGHLTVVDIPKQHHKGRSRTIICRCDCEKGKKELFVTNSSNLLSGATKSCGCRRRVDKTAEEHALDEKLHGMKQRCYNPNHKQFKYWGGKGIKVCDEWLNDSYAFTKWALANGYKLGDTIDRIDVNGDYCPENCRFTDMKTQQNNKTSNVWYTVDGVKKTISQWADFLNIANGTLYHALKRRTPDEANKYMYDKVAERKKAISEYKEQLERFCDEYSFQVGGSRA